MAAPLVGLLVGALTSVLQKHLDLPWLALVNAASPWLVPAFAVGILQRSLGGAALAGVATCAFELVGYYATAAARGHPAGGPAILLFWAGCALVGGPVFGAAGRLWWRGGGRLRGLGVAVLAGAFLAEAAVTYAWRLHYTSTAILFAVIGAAVVALLGLRGHQYAHVARWLLVTVPVGIVAQLALGLVYDQSF